MRLHNSLGRKTEDFQPLSDVVKLYSCGPTVYSYYHIGNLRNAIFNDSLRRALESNGYEVKHVMNITDVGHLDSDADEGEDKLQASARRDDKSVWEVADFYIKAFKDDMAKLNILPPNGYKGGDGAYAKATDFISQQVEIVKILLDNGFAYQPIDIHTGGVDHIGTHHTNEMAQTEAAFGTKLANYWLHNEHLMVEGQKMSKSLGNLITINDLKTKGYDPLSLRLLFLQAHYRSQMNFMWSALEAAAENLQSIRGWADLLHQAHNLETGDYLKFIESIKAALADDLNTPLALAKLNDFIGKHAPSAELLVMLDDLLGLELSGRPDISAQQKKMIEKREEARQTQQWHKADEIRQSLRQAGLELLDTNSGPLWLRK
jgi:cysteinyl-tRNA synthetase